MRETTDIHLFQVYHAILNFISRKKIKSEAKEISKFSHSTKLTYIEIIRDILLILDIVVVAVDFIRSAITA